MTARNFVLTEEDNQYLTPAELRKHADYEGDAETRLALRAMARKLLLLDNPNMAPNKVASFLDSSVMALIPQLSSRSEFAVRATGYQTVRDLFEGGWTYMMKQRNFGERSRLELVALFASHGLIWTEYPCDAPKPTAPVTVNMPVALLHDLYYVAQQSVERFERDHGRFATRGKLLAEYTRLLNIRDNAAIELGKMTNAE
ncbi:hypothetical protein NAD41_002350 [Salmonella enterica]|nr:hypothetical protein [Salmonella enterica]EKK6596318.1 hypothetical protein [Salmonella enterica]